jgi:hypothetical protein
MRRRIERSGIRSISFLVDVTNYVMLEIGQPLHAFDDAELAGAIHVRLPAPGEKLLLLNEQTVTPTADTALIADDEKPLAMAGIMGGEHSGIADRPATCSSKAPSSRRRRSPARRVRWAFRPTPRIATSAASISNCSAAPSNARRN